MSETTRYERERERRLAYAAQYYAAHRQEVLAARRAKRAALRGATRDADQLVRLLRDALAIAEAYRSGDGEK